jgi:O-antigen/teichoic acid export membrane protein
MTAGTNLMLSVLGLVSGILIARLLGPQGRGELAAIQTWPGFISLLATLGLPDAVVFFSSQNRSKSSEYLLSAIILFLLSAIPFVIIGFVLMPVLLAAQSPGIISTTRWYLVIFVILQATQGMLLHPLRGQQAFVPYNLLRIMSGTSWLLVVFLAMVLRTATPQWLAVGYLIMLVATGVPILLVLLKHLPGPYRLNMQLWRPMLIYGLPSAASAIPQSINLRLDQMAMAAFLPPDRLGYYAVAVVWSGALSPILSSVGTVLFPHVAMETSPDAKTEALGRGTRLTTMLALIGGMILFIITPFGVNLLYGRGFSAAIPAALILVVAGGVLNFNGVLEEGLRGLGVPKAILWGECAGIPVTIIALALLLPPFEIVGAAVASLLGYVMTALVLFIQLMRITNRSALYFLQPRSVDFQFARQKLKRIVIHE